MSIRSDNSALSDLVWYSLKIVGVVLLLPGLTCLALFLINELQPAPHWLPPLAERQITTPNRNDAPRISPNGRFVAYLNYGTGILYVYDSVFRWEHVVASGVTSDEYRWDRAGHVTYFKYRPELSGAPFPEVEDMHVVDLNGANDHVVLPHLCSPRNPNWFSNNQKMILLMATCNSGNGIQGVWLIDVATGNKELLISRYDLGVTEISDIALSVDDAELLISGTYVVYGDPDKNAGFFFIYDISSRQIIRTIDQADVFPTILFSHGGSLGGQGYLNYIKVRQQRWIVGNGWVPEGKCYNYSLFSLNVNDLTKSYCIPSVGGVVAGFDVTPDLSRVAYLTVLGPANNFVMLADIADEVRAQLKP